MTDLELVRKCAKVAGIEALIMEGDPDSAPYYHDKQYGVISYWPLTNYEQASQLQDILKIDVLWLHRCKDKLRAICECAAANVED
jgi:hypothetical protein